MLSRIGYGFVAAFSFLVLPAYAGTPCDGINRNLPSQEKVAWAPVIVKQLNEKRPETSSLSHVSSVDVLQSFRNDGWYIVYVDTGVSDEAFLFYEHDPLTSDYVTLWAGTAQNNEDIKNEVIKSAPGIPAKLAGCFAWYFTAGNYD